MFGFLKMSRMCTATFPPWVLRVLLQLGTLPAEVVDAFDAIVLVYEHDPGDGGVTVVSAVTHEI
jgi:hypothetical protein